MRLGLPPGLSTVEFRAEVARVLLENPALEPLSATGVVDSSVVRSFLGESLSVEADDAERSAETLLMWVKEFCEVHVEPSSWRLVLGKEFG